MWVTQIFEVVGKWWPVLAGVAIMFAWLGITDKLHGLISSVKNGIAKLFTLQGLFIFAMLGIIGFVIFTKIMEFVS